MKATLKKGSSSDFIHSDFFILAIGLCFGATAYFLFMGQALLQICSVVGTCLFYVLWGAVHHARQGDLHPKIILEYSLIALLAMALLLTLILRT